jgi:hypothetical protein
MRRAAKGPTAGEFRAALHRRFYEAERRGAAHLEVTAADLCREVGGRHDDGADTLNCCLVMRGEMRTRTDSVLSEPDGGGGKILMIRYKVPRWPQ